MNKTTTTRHHRLVAGSLALLLLAYSTAVPADQPEQTTPDPGFRPPSSLAAAFLESVDTANVAVLPTIIRRSDRSAHSFASQRLIISFLNDSGIAIATAKPRRIDLGPLRRPSQWQIFEYGLESSAAQLAGYDIGADYALVMEIVVPDHREVFGIHIYLLDSQGRNAFSFLLNSHHQMFAGAKLHSDGSSETARKRMIEKATNVGLAALKLQIESAESIAHRLFVETAIDNNSSRFVFRPDEQTGLVVEKTMDLLCEIARLSSSRGYRYFRVDEQTRLAAGRASFRVTFYETLPEGMAVVDDALLVNPDQPPDLRSAGVSAEKLLEACRMMTQ